ncbi:hypothetical protein ACIHDR_41680 [Nocardia sp. NPDC052278]|uniref:hypothetical protein n=1 Tax=unclassified Nocardia TaxID=2637762 RepID=UPI0036A61807
MMNNDSNAPVPELEQLAPGGPHEPTYPVSAGARALGKSERWYTQQLKDGRFPGHKAGRNWFLTASDIDAAIHATRQPATPPIPKQPTDSIRRPQQRRTRRRNPIPPQNR